MASTSSQPQAVADALKRYPVLDKLNLHAVDTPGTQPYKLEFWGPHDSGTKKEPRPKAIPSGQIGVQLFSQDVTPEDVLADVASHYLRKHDPKMLGYYHQFLQSITPDQEKRLHQDYQWAKQNEGETRPYGEWVQQTRLPAYFRGYTFNQWPQSFTSKVFTPQQIQLFNQVRSYLGMDSGADNGN